MPRSRHHPSSTPTLTTPLMHRKVIAVWSKQPTTHHWGPSTRHPTCTTSEFTCRPSTAPCQMFVSATDVFDYFGIFSPATNPPYIDVAAAGANAALLRKGVMVAYVCTISPSRHVICRRPSMRWEFGMSTKSRRLEAIIGILGRMRCGGLGSKPCGSLCLLGCRLGDRNPQLGVYYSNLKRRMRNLSSVE
ncbi:hypothetical protein B0T25DRAFT_177235 [Lasiosphaeria hispida]|uniref:Uncharacterized protein n=1 Tax=Lasiosphaeria hispida TaxID=260671 RepID=A0AAJ0MGU0_9PEZI|nr:hypothetical protein B0T25DRAFT_177235 [Lasiosphaeria hispida]